MGLVPVPFQRQYLITGTELERGAGHVQRGAREPCVPGVRGGNVHKGRGVCAAEGLRLLPRPAALGLVAWGRTDGLPALCSDGEAQGRTGDSGHASSAYPTLRCARRRPPCTRRKARSRGATHTCHCVARVFELALEGHEQGLGVSDGPSKPGVGQHHHQVSANVNVNVNGNERRLGFSNTTRNPRRGERGWRMRRYPMRCACVTISV